MKNVLTYLILIFGGLVIWQWWLSRRNADLYDLDQQRKQSDAAGKAQENLQMSGRQRMMSDEGLWRIWGWITNDSEILGDNSMVTGGSTPKNPFIFGYN